MKRVILSALLLMVSNTYATCSQFALEYAIDNQSEIWNIEEAKILAEVVDDEFNETYGSGYYNVFLTDGDKEALVSVDMHAYTNQDDSALTCELVGIFGTDK
jgi:hypothetical protein